MKKRILSVFIILGLVLTLVPAAFAAEKGGTCGDALTWALSDDGVLTISGTGAISDYDSTGRNIPWYEYLKQIKAVRIESGVTSVGDFAFSGCPNLETADIPESVTRIGDYAFYCSGLRSIEIPSSVLDLGMGVCSGCTDLKTAVFKNDMAWLPLATFDSCASLTAVVLPLGLTGIYGHAFSRCSSLAEITIPAGVTFIGYNAFSGVSALKDVYYMGSEEEWAGITVETGNGPLTGASVKCNFVPVPDAPENLAASNKSSGVFLTWNAVRGAESYAVYRDGVLIASVEEPSCTDTSARSGAECAYTVRAEADGKSSGDSAAVKNIYLSMPANVKAANEEGGIRVSWEKVEGAGSYTVFRRSEGSSKWTAQYTTSSASTVSYLNKAARDLDGTFYYTVRANAVKDGVSYTSSKATTGTKIVRSLAPAAPVIKSVANGFSSILIKWDKVDDADGYYIYRRTGAGEWKKVKTVVQPVSGSTVSFGNTSTENGVMYAYKIVAYRSVNEKTYRSAESAEKSYMRLTNPVLTAKSTTAGRISFGWTKNAAASGYQIEYTEKATFTGAVRKTLNGADKLSTAYSGFTSGTEIRVRVRAFYKYTDASGALKYCYGTWSSADESGASTQVVKVK